MFRYNREAAFALPVGRSAVHFVKACHVAVQAHPDILKNQGISRFLGHSFWLLLRNVAALALHLLKKTGIIEPEFV